MKSGNKCSDTITIEDTEENRYFWLSVCEEEGLDKSDWMPKDTGDPIIIDYNLAVEYLSLALFKLQEILK